VRASSPALYAAAAARVLARHRTPRLGGHEERLVFVCGSPRSGTTFLAGALGAQPGLVDLGEVKPLKILIPLIAGAPPEEAAPRFRRVLERVRRLAFSAHLRGVEQTPETAFILPAVLAAYASARAIHLVRDGRDVVSSLLERGWLSAGREGSDDAKLPYGDSARFWVEPERRSEFEQASDATRAAWAWRSYVSAARAVQSDRVLELRYEELTSDPAVCAARLGAFLGADEQLLAERLVDVHERSVGRYRRDLSPGQLADVEREAGPLLRELGYARS
jgi:Sulfotransferase family